MPFRGWFGISVVALGVAVTHSAATAAQEAEFVDPEVPAYELPEVIVDTTKKPAKKPQPSSGGGGGGSPSSSTQAATASGGGQGAAAGGSEVLEPVPAEATGFAEGGAAGAGIAVAPAVSNAGFTSGRIVEQVGTVEEVTAEQIERVGARTLDEAISLMPGVYVRNGGDGVPRIDIRGMRTRNIILLVDGVPLNGTYDGQFDPRTIPVENIARIKVTRGGSSVLYGPGGNAAVIDIISKGAGPGLQATFDTSVGFGQNEDARATASYGTDTVKTFLSASIYNQDAFHLSDDFAFTTLQPNDRRVNSDREDRAFYGNTQIKVTEDIQWGFSVNYREGEYGKPPGTWNSEGGQGCRNTGTDPSAPFNWGECNPFASGLRFERVDDFSNLSLQTSGLIDLGGGLTLRPLAYYNANNELTNRFDDKDYATQLLNGAFREDAETSIYGGGGQIAYRPDENNLVTIALDAHRETWDAEGFEGNSTNAQTNVSAQSCNSTCQNNLQTDCTTNRGGTLLVGPISFRPRFNNNNILIGYQARQACVIGRNAILSGYRIRSEAYAAALRGRWRQVG